MYLRWLMKGSRPTARMGGISKLKTCSEKSEAAAVGWEPTLPKGQYISQLVPKNNSSVKIKLACLYVDL